MGHPITFTRLKRPVELFAEFPHYLFMNVIYIVFEDKGSEMSGSDLRVTRRRNPRFDR
jgi:hypothetical protein